MLKKIALLLVLNALGFYLLDLARIIIIEPTFLNYAIVTIVYTIINILLKPIVQLLSFPFLIITLGLFSLVINGLLLWGTDYLMEGLKIDGIWNIVFATIVFTLLNSIGHILERE